MGLLARAGFAAIALLAGISAGTQASQRFETAQHSCESVEAQVTALPTLAAYAL